MTRVTAERQQARAAPTAPVPLRRSLHQQQVCVCVDVRAPLIPESTTCINKSNHLFFMLATGTEPAAATASSEGTAATESGSAVQGSVEAGVEVAGACVCAGFPTVCCCVVVWLRVGLAIITHQALSSQTTMLCNQWPFCRKHKQCSC